MKRLLLALGFAATVVLAGCGGGGGGGGSVPAPNNPGNPGGGGGGGGATPTPQPSGTAIPNTVISIATPGPVAMNAVNTQSSAQSTGTVGRITATQNGTPLAAGAALSFTLFSNDTSGSTCLVYVPNGSNSGTACTFPAPGSTPQPVAIKNVGDGIAVQYNDGPTAPGGTFTISASVGGANTIAFANPSPGLGHTAAGDTKPWGGGILYNNGYIYITQNSTSNPLGYVTYSSGAASSAVADVTGVSSLTSAPAGGLIMGPDGRLWGTEQNNTNVFAVAVSGAAGVATEYGISCPNGTSAGSPGNANVLGPQTGIATDGTSVYVLCADVANGSAAGAAHNLVIQINPTTGATVATCAPGSFGPFANGAIYSNGNIYTEELIGGGHGAGNASSGNWLTFPVGNNLATCASNFAESGIVGTGSGNVNLFAGNLYSETDNESMSTTFTGATAANPAFPSGDIPAGGLGYDAVLKSGAVVGTAQVVDAILNTKWSGGTQTVLSASQPLNPNGAKPNGGECEVAFNTGGGFGVIQLPDGKFAWPVATDAQEPNRNWICILNP